MQIHECDTLEKRCDDIFAGRFSASVLINSPHRSLPHLEGQVMETNNSRVKLRCVTNEHSRPIIHIHENK